MWLLLQRGDLDQVFLEKGPECVASADVMTETATPLNCHTSRPDVTYLRMTYYKFASDAFSLDGNQVPLSLWCAQAA
jgi:hypothetical protein